jgi:hypothetical protein
MDTGLVRRVVRGLLLLPLLASAASAFAELDPPWLTGRWEATAESPGGAHFGQDSFQLTVKPDGKFEEAIRSARGGRLHVVGTWKISGETAVLDGTYQGGPTMINGTRKTLTLRRDGEALEGTRVTHYNSQTLPIRLVRAK